MLAWAGVVVVRSVGWAGQVYVLQSHVWLLACPGYSVRYQSDALLGLIPIVNLLCTYRFRTCAAAVRVLIVHARRTLLPTGLDYYAVKGGGCWGFHSDDPLLAAAFLPDSGNTSSSGSCDVACPGDQYQKCGGRHAFDLYAVNPEGTCMRSPVSSSPVVSWVVGSGRVVKGPI